MEGALCCPPGTVWRQCAPTRCFCTSDSNLVVRRGKPEEVVADLIKHLGSVSTVALHEEVGWRRHGRMPIAPSVPPWLHRCRHVSNAQVTSEELNVEKRVRDVCARMKVRVHTCWGSTLYHRDDLPFNHIARLERMHLHIDIQVLHQNLNPSLCVRVCVYLQVAGCVHSVQKGGGEPEQGEACVPKSWELEASPPRAGRRSHSHSRGTAGHRWIFLVL